MFNNFNNNISNTYHKEFKVQSNVEDKTKADNEENSRDKSFENLLKKFKEIDIKFEGKKRVEDEFKMAIDKLESEDEKFNFDLKNQKKKMEKS